MSIISIRGMRVSTTMQSQMLLEQMRLNQLSMFNNQQQMASGQRMLLPSDDPAGATQALRLSDLLTRYTQLQSNVSYADTFGAATETALSDVRDALNQANTIASQSAGSLVTADQRSANATVVDGLIDTLLSVANRQQSGVYLFAGQQTDRQPFIEDLDGILYQGDTNESRLNLDGNGTTAVSLRGDQVFGGISAEVGGTTDLTPRVYAITRLTDVRGAEGDGISPGRITIGELGGAGSFTVDLSDAPTLGSIVSKINAACTAAGADIVALLTANGISLTQGSGLSFSVTEAGSGRTAADLGILTSGWQTGTFDGKSLQPVLSLTTPLSWLRGGAGIDKLSGIVLTNGGKSKTLKFDSATTLQDVINKINATDLGVHAGINDAGTGIDVVSRLSGSNLTIGENGGTTAADLGIRSFTTATSLASLNDGQGVATVTGDDMRIVAKDGSTVDIDLDGCQTIQDAIDKINTAATAAGVAVAADLVGTGNGIRLTDTTGGAGPLQVQSLNASSAAADLGLLKDTSGAVLSGDDVNPIRTNGIFTVLNDLREALRSNDTAGITRAGERIGDLLQAVGLYQGQAAARSKSILAQLTQIGDASLSAKSMLSDVKDVDLTEAITRFTQAQTTLQANLMTGSKLMQMSLLDFLQ